MDLKEQLMADIKSAMKNKESEKLATLRFLHSAIKNKEIDSRPKELTEEDLLSVVKKAVKQRKEAIEQFQTAGRQDLVDKESSELKILSEYLPAQLSSEQVASIVDEVVAALGANSMKQMGAVMKEVMAKTNGAADNKLISQLIKDKLN